VQYTSILYISLRASIVINVIALSNHRLRYHGLHQYGVRRIG